MKRYILSVLFGMLPVLFSAAQSEVSLTAIGSQTTELKDGDTFTALTEEGVEMTFMVISEADKTCQVGSCPLSTTNWWSTPAIDEKTSGVVTIPSTINGYKVTRIGNWGFVYCFYLTSVNIPEGLESIGMLAFYSCQHLSSIKIPASVSYIGDNAFEITRLESVSVAEGNTFYDSRNNCNAIIETATNTLKTGCKNTIIPNDIVIIDNAAFYDCFGLTEVKLPETLTTIGRSAFAGCEDLKAINIPKNVTSISDYVFNDTPSLQSITVDSNNPVYDSRDNCNALIETASNTLMAGCQNTVIPTSVTSIGKSAFHQCSTLTSITIPRNVVRIGEGAFSWCKGLTTITSHITSPFTVTNIGFSEEVYQTATLYVPQGTKALYEATEGWKQFANIVEMGGEEETPAEAIDLGLPSGTKWASWTVGASKPEEYGDYYAWGETETKEEYTKENYAFYQNGSYQTAIGNIRMIYGTSNYDISKTEYDVAYVKWGENWRMPTLSESQELSLYCTWEETTINNVKVNKVTGPNGKYIYLPFAGSSSSQPVWNCLYTTSTRMGRGLRHAFSGGYSIETGFCVRPVSGDFVEIREVRTGDAVDITDNTASLEGFATSDVEGISCIGFYYSTSDVPTAENSIFIQASSIGSYGDYKASINNLTEGTTYYYRAVYVGNNSQYFGDVHYFKTTGGDVDESTIAEAVDLGLSVKWASWNIGASRPEGFGGYYAWGETDTKKDYTWNTYLCNEDNCCTSADPIYAAGLWANGIQGSEYDVAHVKWGGKWRMPKPEEILELLNSCTWTMTTQNDVEGYQVTAVNGNSIFIPAAGYRLGTNTAQSHEWANYWSSYPNSFGEECASEFTFWYQSSYRSDKYIQHNHRAMGFTVRAVLEDEESEAIAQTKCILSISVSGNGTVNYNGVSIADKSTRFLVTKGSNAILLFTPDNGYSLQTVLVDGSPVSPSSNSSYVLSRISANTEVQVIFPSATKPSYVSAIDLGLPSGLKWSNVNIGASEPQNRGSYFSWGESQTKNAYLEEFYDFYQSGAYQDIGEDISRTNYDVAKVKWGGNWKMPTKKDFAELLDNCTFEETTLNDVTGQKVTGPNGNSIFLPYTSCANGRVYQSGGYLRSSTSSDASSEDSYIFMYHRTPQVTFFDKYWGMAVRPVCDGPEDVPIELSDTETTMYESGTSTIDLIGGSGSYSLQSSDESVAKAEIIGGKLVITCIGEGTATITIIDKATGQTAVVSVTVVPPIKPTKRLYVYVGKKYTLNINGGTGKYSIRSFNESIVTAEFIDGVATITGISEGSTKLEVADNITLQKDTIDVICIKPTPVHIYVPTVTVYVGKSYPVDINGGTGSYTIRSSNESVVTARFQDGNAMITGVGVGSATITVTDEITEQKDSFYVHAIIAPVELSTREVPVVVGNTEKVSIISAGTFTVRSSDESIATATVANGNVVIKGVSEGKVTLTVTNTSTQKSETIVVTSYFDSVTPGDLIDLGLPSGTKWASRNVGAGSPTDYGSYFAWGETTPKESYNWANYKHYNWTGRSLTKYCTSSSYGTVDNKTTLDLEDDAAHANWGGDWRMPTHEESTELIDKCQWLRVIINGVLGKKCIGPNGNSIFFPASGVRFDDALCYKGVDGQYWQSESGDNDLGAWRIYLFDVIRLERYAGLTVRPVCDGTPAHACDLSDIPTTSAYYGPTAFLCDRTVIHGSDEDGRMAVNMPLKRAHLAKIAYRGVNLLNGRQVPATSVTNNFPTIYSDLTTPTEANSYYFQAAKALQYLEYGDGVSAFDRDRLEFNPSDSIQRVNVLKALMEAFNIKPDVVGTDNPFPNDPDAKAILNGNPQKFGYIRKAADLGIITKDNDKFRPFDYCLRGEAFIMLYRIMTKIEAGEIKDPNPQIADYFQPLNTTQKTIAMGSDMSMGNFRNYSKTDFAIPGVMPLTFAHSYNSYSTTLPGVFYGQKMVNGVDETYQPMGPGWSHNYQGFVCVIGKSEDLRAVVNIGGRMLVFKSNGSKLVPESFGVYDELKIENSEVILKTKGQVEYTFSKQSGSKMPLLYLSSIKDRNGNELTLTYADGKNDTKVLSSVSDGNRELTFEYKSGTDLLEEVSDPLGRSISFGYEYNGNTGEYMLSSFTDAEGNTTSYSYGDEGQRSTARLLKRILLPKGNYIENEYDANRRLTQNVTGLNNVPQTKTTVSVTTDYTSTADTKSTVNVERGNNTSTYKYVYNENNAVTSLTGNDDLSISCTYDDNTQPQLPTSVETNSTNISKVEYDDRGNILSVTEKSNNGSGERTVTMSYNTMNDVTSFTDALGNTTTFSYNGSGNLISISEPEGVTTERTVDSRGLTTTATSPMGIKTNFDYNKFGNVIETSIPVLDLVSSIRYDAASRPLSITDPLGRTSYTTYNRNDQVTEEEDAMGHTTQYDYDPNGNLTTITNAKGGVTTLTYDNTTDWLTSMAFAGSTKQYSYNKDGSLNTFTKPDGTRLNYSYDALGRVTSDGVNSYSYDSKLRLKSISGNGQTLTYNYDGFNRVSSVSYSGSSSNTVSYGYDDNDNLTSMTYPGGNKVSYQYDNLDRLTSVKAWNGKQVSYSYRKDGQLSSISYPNGMRTAFSYDEAGRMVEKKTTLSNGTVIASYGYELDKNGKITGQATKEPYDISGPEGKDTEFSYNSGNRITRAGSVSFTFDSNGNTTKRGSDSYTWDVQDRLVSAEGKSYVYDPLGNIRKYGNTEYTIDPLGIGNVLSDTQTGASYVYGNGLEMRIVNGVTQYFVTDSRGSVVAIVDESGNITHKYQYDEFGKVIQSKEADFNPFRYVGKWGVMYNTDTHYYMRARHYDPTIGRFLSEDPIWSTNLYPYADNNPIMGIDPEGLFTDDSPEFKKYKAILDKKYNNKEIDYNTYHNLVNTLYYVPSISMTIDERDNFRNNIQAQFSNGKLTLDDAATIRAYADKYFYGNTEFWFGKKEEFYIIPEKVPVQQIEFVPLPENTLRSSAQNQNGNQIYEIEDRGEYMEGYSKKIKWLYKIGDFFYGKK